MTPLTVIKTAAVVVAVAVGAALAAITLLPAALGLQQYVIVGGSMSGTIDRGSVVFDKEVPVEALQTGDVITYTPPARSGSTDFVTHRIVSIHTARGERVFRTKGDANAAPDPWTFTLDQARQAKVIAHVPYLGYPLAALQIRWVRMLVIGVPALLIALLAVGRLVADARAERRHEAVAMETGMP